MAPMLCEETHLTNAHSNAITYPNGRGQSNGNVTGLDNGNELSIGSFSAGRLAKPMTKLLQRYNEQPKLTWELNNLRSVLRVDEAHAVMLAEQSLITQAQARAILRVIDQLKSAGPTKLSPVPGYGSILLQIERVLAMQIGEDTAGRLSIARSRLDQGATVRRISDRDSILEVANSTIDLLGTLVKIAEKHKDTATLSYTHLQQAQPATFGHYLLAFEDRLEDALEQLTQLYSRIDRSPLGAVGLSGTNLPTNRHRTASLLGFSQILDNSRRGRDAYYQIEMACTLAMIMTILNDLCTDLHVFSSAEFGTIEIDDSHCSTSSVFPQKKNPYALETVKNIAQDAQGWVATALAAFRNEGTGDTANRAIGLLNGACEKTSGMLLLTSEILDLMTVNEGRWEILLENAWVTTNYLANTLLLKHGMSYRAAHGVAARLVKNCIAQGVLRADVTIDMLHTAAREMGVEYLDMGQQELRAALDPKEYIRNSSSFGSVGPKQFDRLLTASRERIASNVLWIEGKEEHLANAEAGLREATEKLR